MQYKQIAKQLDAVNIRILSAMSRYGPRNLLEVSRRVGMPFTTVYHRIDSMERRSQELVFLVPSVTKLGMVRIALLIAASSGREEEVTGALKAPNLWRAIGFCEGSFTHYAIQVVPVCYLKKFRSYLQQLIDSNLITNFMIIPTGDYIPNFPDFEYYNPTDGEWKFDWEGWLTSLNEERDGASYFEDPEGYCLVADSKDLLVIKELEKDGRKSFADIGRAIGMSSDGVKYHYQKLMSFGIVKYFQFRVHPFPSEISAYHEVMLEFNSRRDMNKFLSIIPRLFFVLGFAKVLRNNALMLQTWMIQSQLPKMFSFFSQMVRAGFLKSYSAVRMDFGTRLTQTISYELFDDNKGWVVDLEKCLAELPEVEKVKVTSQ